MSIDSSSTSSSSIHSSRDSFAPPRLGSSRPSRPAQIDPAVASNLAGGADPQAIDEMSHASAAALLDRVHHSQDPQIVQRVLTLVEREGVDIIAQLWSHSEPDSLPGMLWRLYLLRTWMHNHQESLSRLWRTGEPVATSASAVAGVDQMPDSADIAHTADSILSGAFTGDFAVALERAAAFTDVIANGLRLQAKRLAHRPDANSSGSTPSTPSGNPGNPGNSDSTNSTDSAGNAAGTGNPESADNQTSAARILHTASNLMVTSQDFRRGANQWRRGKLE